MRRILLILALMVGQAQAAAPDMNQQLQTLMSSKKGQSNIGQVLAIGTLLGCTQKQAGKEATQAFYQEMNTVGKTVESYCKQGNATEARALVLSTLDAKQNDLAVKAALNCYDSNTANLNALAGPKAAEDAARYARWIRDPQAAKREVKEGDICKNNRTAKKD